MKSKCLDDTLRMRGINLNVHFAHVRRHRPMYYCLWTWVVRKVQSNGKYLTFITHLANSADDKLVVFFLIFPRKQDLTFHANCLQWICMKCQILYTGKNKKKNITNLSSAENFAPSAKSLTIIRLCNCCCTDCKTWMLRVTPVKEMRLKDFDLNSQQPLKRFSFIGIENKTSKYELFTTYRYCSFMIVELG